MKKQLLFASAAVMLSASVWATHSALTAPAPLSDATEVDYDLSSLGSRTGSTGRYISGVVLSTDTEELTVGPACSNGNTQIYFDLSDQAFSVLPGTEVSVTVTGFAEWMHTYAYVDWNKDGFNYSQPSDLIDLDTFMPVEGSDLVWYNAWCPNADESGTWGDSAGNKFSKAGDGHNKTIPCNFTFTVPEGTPAGDYRMRVKSAWQSLDPNGGRDAAASNNTIQANGGNVVDFTITVLPTSTGDEIVEWVNELTYNTEGTWTISNFCCEETSGEGSNGRVAQLIDDDASTFYHSNWTGESHGVPHHFVIDLGESRSVSGFAWTPRQSKGSNNGRWEAYEVFASDNADDFTFANASALAEWYATNAGNGQAGTLSAVAGDPAETAMFDEAVNGRYILFVIPTANGGFSCAAEVGLYLQRGITASELRELHLAEIAAKLDEVRALAQTYKENIPGCVAEVNGMLATLDEIDPEMMLEDYDMLDEVLQAFAYEPLNEAVISSLQSLVGKQIYLYQHNQRGFLNSQLMVNRKGWYSFYFSSSLADNCAWTLVDAGNNQFYLKSAGDKYIASPEVGFYCKAVDTEDEADRFSFGLSNGYVTFASASLEGAGLALDGQNDPVEIMAFGNDPTATFTGWQVGEYVIPSEENPTYYIFESKRAAGSYLADHADAVTSTKGTDNYGTTTLYRQEELNPNAVWAVTPGVLNGTYRVKNYVTGKYLVKLKAYCDETSEEPVEIYMLPTADGGFSLSTDGVADNQTSIDANNFNECVGSWIAGDAGTTWFRSEIEVGEDQEMTDALDSFRLKKILAAAAATFEPYRNMMPEISGIVTQAIGELNYIKSLDGVEEKIENVRSWMFAQFGYKISEMVSYKSLLTFSNSRRAGLGQDALLAVADDATLNTIGQDLPAALWYLIRSYSVDGAFNFYNVGAQRYLGSVDGAPALVESADEAVALNISYRDNGTINFTDPDGNLLNMNTYGGVLEFYGVADDEGSQWTIGSANVGNMFSETYPIHWNDVLEGDKSTEYDESEGNALSSFYLDFNMPVQFSGMTYAYVYNAEGAILAYLYEENLSIDESTNRVTFTLPEPLGTYDAYYYAYIPAGAFFCTNENGGLVYSPQAMSYYVHCTKLPDTTKPLTVTPAAGTLEAVSSITFTLGEEGTQINYNSDKDLTITKDFAEFLTVTPIDLEGIFNEETNTFTIEANITEEGVYTMTIPEGLIFTGNGVNELTTVTWDVDPFVGITNVTVNGEPAEVYDLNGRRLAAPAKGLNIVNGVKTLIRK